MALDNVDTSSRNWCHGTVGARARQAMTPRPPPPAAGMILRTIRNFHTSTRIPVGVETEVEVAVIGAGQAGLSSAYFLRRSGLEPATDFVVLDRNRGPGGAWQHRWPTLTFATVHGIYQLPGMALPEPDPQTPV